MRLAICAIIKNEEEYLKDWLDYHLSIGFTDIHLFEDKGSVSHRKITDAYDNVYVEPFSVIGDYMSGHFKQKRLYQWFYDTHVDDYDWCAFIDIDEYFMFEEGYDLERLTEEFNDCQGIYLYWRYHTANGLIYKSKDKSVVDTYPEFVDMQLKTDGPLMYKSFVNFNIPNFRFVDHHTMSGLYNTDGEVNGYGEKYRTFSKAWLAHYFTKSWEDWCDKMFWRGDIFNNHRFFDDFFELNKDMGHLRETCYKMLEERIIKEYDVNTLKIFIHTHKNIENNTPDNDFYVVTTNNPDVTSDKFDVLYLDDDFTKNHRISYGEATTMRYLWKHPELLPDIVGMCHNRRFFKDNCDDRYNIIRTICKQNAIITKAYPHGDGNTNEMVMSGSHIPYDAELIDSIVEEHFPKYLDGYNEMKSRCDMHPCNMFVMRKNDFLEMCDFIFGVMEIYDERQGFENDDDVLAYVERTKAEGKWYYGIVDWQKRLQGFWIEWLVDAFVSHKWGINNVLSSEYVIYGELPLHMIESDVTEDQLIVALTTWPPRFGTVSKTLESLVKASEGLNCHIVLVISEEDRFLAPLTFDALNLMHKHKIELILDKGNIRSHKKLVPVLEKYPNNDILICDDDKIYDEDFIRNFLEDHEKYPNDVIVGGSFFNLKINDDNTFVCENNDSECVFHNTHEPYEVLHIAKPANGCFGTYYPKHTFTDERFFDRKAMMELSEFSDEDWHYLFNVIEDRTLRMTGHVKKYGYQNNNGDGPTALCQSYGAKYYEDINKVFAEKYPEYAEKMKIRLRKYLSVKKKSLPLRQKIKDILTKLFKL